MPCSPPPKMRRTYRTDTRDETPRHGDRCLNYSTLVSQNTSSYYSGSSFRSDIPVECRFDAAVRAQCFGAVQLQAAGKRQHRVQIVNHSVRLRTDVEQNDVVVLKTQRLHQDNV